jgi:RND family efflux transporter MFP subunit
MNRARRWGALVGALLPAAAVAQALGCLIEPYRVSEVGSPIVGVIETAAAERGDLVRAGQVLATLRADVERQSLAVAQSKADAVGELRAAEANAELARQKLARAKDLADKQFISSQALEQARAEAMVAENRLEQAREQRDVYAREHQLAEAQLGQRTIRSPFAGVIAERYLSAGEHIDDKPIYRVAMINPLRVEVVLPAAAYATVRRGMSVTVLPEFPGATPRQAKVTLVDRVIDGASNTFRLRMELPNPDLSLPAGLRCKVDLGVPAGTQRGSPAPSARRDGSALQFKSAPALVGQSGPNP